MDTSRKDWWAPIWRGLVVDPEGKHVRRLKSAIALFLYLVLHAKRGTGFVARKQATIASDMGISLWTVRTWMRRLRDTGYITSQRTGRATVIRILRWRGLGQSHADQMGTGMPIRWAETQRSDAGESRKREHLSGEFAHVTTSNESLLTRSLLQEQSGGRSSPSPTMTSEETAEKAREELLAADLAAGLDDPGGLRRYRAHAHRHPEVLLRRLLSEARAVPENKIKRSRAALFTYLLNQHVNGNTKDSRD